MVEIDTPSTTTISTIAINAGNQATIVVALLKSVGYASLRIDEMRPRMLDLGRNTAETAQLAAIHEDLMRRLKSKEDQVEELLARADHLVTQQTEPEVHVYEAMAESLGLAWKELNRQLQMRGFLLTETSKFYDYAERHERLSAEVRRVLRTEIANPSIDLYEAVLRTQRLIDELIDVTASAVDSGADVITQIRVLGAMADNVESNQETAEACLLIEETMLKMATEWELLEESWRTERSKIESQIDVSAAILASIEEIENWLANARIKLNEGHDFNAHLQQAFKQRAALKNTLATIERSSSHSNLMERGTQLETDLANFVQEIKSRKDENDKVIAWIAAANTMLSQLKAMESDMRNANAAMAGELAPLAKQKAQVVIEDGQRLLSTDMRVKRFIDEIEKKLKEIEELAHERIITRKNEAKEQLNRFEEWIVEKETYLSRTGRIGSNLVDATQFYSTHKSLVTDIINKEMDLGTIIQRSSQLNKVDQERLEDLKNRYIILKKTIDSRVNVGAAFQQVHKFAKEMESSFESLNSLISSDQNFTNDKMMTQMREVFRMVEETIHQEKHQGDKFIESASTLSTTDKRLDITEAVESIRDILNEHHQRYTTISDKWTQWKDKKREEEKIVRTVEEVQIWQEETLEIIHTLEEKFVSTKSMEEREEISKKVEEIIDNLPQQREKISEIERITGESEERRGYDRLQAAKQMLETIEEKLTRFREQIITEKDYIVQERKLSKPPVITKHLQDAQVDEGSRFEFTAHIEAKPPPEIHWFKDNRDVRDNIDYRTTYVNNVATLIIDETFIEDTAVYTVRAENPAGSAESSAKLVVKSRSEMGSQVEEQTKPRFIRQLRNITVTEGENAVLDCVLVGYPEPKVVWYKEEEAVKESERITLLFEGDHCSLIINGCTPADSGLYTLKATNICGESTNFCRLTVQQAVKVPPPTPPKPHYTVIPPSLSPVLTNQVVREGDCTVFETQVLGEPTPAVRWTKDDVLLCSSSEIQVEDETSGWSRVIIENTRPEHFGMYTIIAENEAGEARSGATLHIEPKSIDYQHENIKTVSEGFWSDSALMSSPTPPPVPKHRYYVSEFEDRQRTEFVCSPTATVPEFIRPFQNEYTVSEGEKFRMDCLMIGNPRPKVHWYFNDELISMSSKFCTFSNIGDTYSVHLEPARLDHAGVYKMTAENIRGKTESVFVLQVRPRSYKPTTTEHVRVTEEFGAYEYKQLIPDYRYIQQMRSNDDEMYYEGEQRRLATKQYQTRLLTPPPAKKQQLQTVHSQQQKISERYDIEERRQLGQPPHFTQTLVSAIAACGDTVRFEGLVTGWPTPEVTWSKDGVLLSKVSNPEMTFSNIGGRVSLSFLVDSVDHAGKYMCSARNTSGVATSSAQLVVRPRTVAPDFIRRLISEEVAEGEGLKWTVQVTGDPVPKVTWLRDSQPIPNCEEVRLVDEGNGVHSMVIVRVEMADSGQFTCLAENVAGEARSTADLVVRSAGSEPGKYFHVTKVTQEKQVKGEEINRNETIAIEEPIPKQLRS